MENQQKLHAEQNTLCIVYGKETLSRVRSVFVLDVASQLRLADILTFWTGADTVPPCGFNSQLTVSFYDPGEDRRLPSSSTCSLTLWLPRGVDDPDILWALLLDAVHMSAGFGKI